MRELRVPSDADDTAIQGTLMKLSSAQVRDQLGTVVVEGQALKAQSSDPEQALKATVSDQISSDQPESESKPSRSV